MKHGKKYIESAALVDRLKQYDPMEGMELVCKTAKAKFDETVEVSVRLGVDSRHADQQVRSASWSSPRATRPTRLRKPALTTSATRRP